MIFSNDGLEINYLTPSEVKAWQAYSEIPEPTQRNAPMIQRLEETGLWIPSQIAGRRWPMGCVSLEITQRCNLDCTLCYLSEHSEAVRDIPLAEIFRRIDLIEAHYGKNTDIQVSGGDPTLRNRDELIQIVKRITDKGMRAALFTNGILATRELLEDLCQVGLVDVAFHVDMTQQRKGFHSEMALNGIREKYIDRVRGLPLAVYFNTTVYEGNFHEIPALVHFFRKHTDVVRLISFQLQANTGRGVLKDRAVQINPETTIEKIQAGANKALRFDGVTVGHPSCNRYAIAFSINGNLYDVYDDPAFIARVLEATKDTVLSRTDRFHAVKTAGMALLKTPQLWGGAARWFLRILWAAKFDLWAARGKVGKLSFYIHNFMDACHLEHDRVKACVFMVATQDGPLSMCLHNAKRDDYILRPFPVESANGEALWQPLGERGAVSETDEIQRIDPKIYPIKHLKGRLREQLKQERNENRLSGLQQALKTDKDIVLED